MAHEPDSTFDPADPKTPSAEGKKLRSLYKMIPNKVGAFETADGTYGLFVAKEAAGELSQAARPPFRRNSDHLTYLGADIAAPLREKPEWARLYRERTGQPIPAIPVWYEERLVINGEIPFRHGFHVEAALKADGWASKRSEIGDYLIKQYGAVWVRARLASYSHALYLSANTLPAGIETKDWDKFQEDTRREIEDFRKVALKDIDAAARQVAARVKAWKPAPQRRNPEHLYWRDEVGKAALDLWRKEIRAAILDIFSGPHPPKGVTTQSIVNNLLHNYMLEITGLNRYNTAVQIRRILDKLAAEGLVEVDHNGRNPTWWPGSR